MRGLALLALVACSETSATSPVVPVRHIVAPIDAPAIAEPDAAPVVVTQPGFDFIADVNVLYRVAACGHPDEPLPELITHGDATRAAKLKVVVDRHCKDLAVHMDKYRKEYFGTARDWFVAHQPPNG